MRNHYTSVLHWVSDMRTHCLNNLTQAEAKRISILGTFTGRYRAFFHRFLEDQQKQAADAEGLIVPI
jgi:hypothetical protein